MGRITVFTLHNDAACRKTLEEFAQREIPVVEICLTRYPQKRIDMLQLSNRMDLPQVFINDEHVGGAEEAAATLESWEESTEEYATPLDRFTKEIKTVNGPKDPRLAIPTKAPLPLPVVRDEESELEKRRYSGVIELPGTTTRCVTPMQMTRHLMKTMPRSDLTWRGKTYRNCFKGTEGVKSLMESFHLTDPEEAVTFGRVLQRKQILDHVKGEHKFGNTEKFFRLQPYHRPNVLNSFCVWTQRVDPSPNKCVEKLLTTLKFIRETVTDKSGFVDYVEAEKKTEYKHFEEAVCELQGVALGSMDERQRKAFAINLYNLLIFHAFIKVGVYSYNSGMQRLQFFKQVSYDVGGEILTLDEIEHGILRANTRPPNTLMSPLNGSRSRLALKQVDPRIHFAISCGANSCPHVRTYTAEAVDEELRIAAMEYCELDDNVFVGEDKTELALSSVFQWYTQDFTKSSSKLPEVALAYTNGDKNKRLRAMLMKPGGHLKVRFIPFDWGTDALRCKTYEPKKKFGKM